jgi:urocanate hydratase
LPIELRHAPYALRVGRRPGSCHGWEQEGILRCLLNNLDPAVAENSDALIVVIGTEQPS